MSHGEYFRIHRAGESLDTVLDAGREDGWVASDEDSANQPRGISCCGSVGDLLSYCRMYSMTVDSEDVLLRLRGSICDDDRDEYALRVDVESYEVMGSAGAVGRLVESRVDPDRVDSLLESWS